MPLLAPCQLQLFEESPPQAPPETVRVVVPQISVQTTRRLSDRLRRLMGRSLGSLVLTDNRTRIISGRPAAKGRGLDVRIHRCFVDAPDAALQAVADFLLSRRSGQRRRQALQVIREHFVRHVAPSPPVARSRLPVLRPVGKYFDLRVLRDDLNREYFDGEIEVAITWGRASGAGRRRRRRCGFSVRLGSYNERQNVVRIHRGLDRADVPRYVVESVVYHEMLHAALPPRVHNGRRRLHPPEFRRRERLFQQFAEAGRWIDEHLGILAGLR